MHCADNDCLNPRFLSRCSRNAVCVNAPERGAVRCLCQTGFVDRSRGSGRVCVPRDAERQVPAVTLRRPPIFEPLNDQLDGYNMSARVSSLNLSFRACPHAIRNNVIRQHSSSADNECRDARLNNCSRNAICYDLQRGYRCECIQVGSDQRTSKEDVITFSGLRGSFT